MPQYSVTLARSARREIEALPQQIARRVITKIESFAHEPRPAGCKKLQGPSGLWRVRVGEYRIVYDVDDRHQPVLFTAF